MSYLGGFLGANTPAIGLGGSLGANSLSGLGGALGSGGTLPTPVGWWKFNEGSGTLIHDSSVSANTLSTQSGNDGVWGSLPGTSTPAFQMGTASIGVLSSGYVAAQDLGNHAMTLSAWVNLNSTATNAPWIITNLNTGAGFPGFLMFVTAPSSGNAELGFNLNNATTNIYLQVNSNSGGAIKFNNTNFHICLTYDGSGSAAGVAFYINGALVPSGTPSFNALSSNTANSTTPLSIGTSNPIQQALSLYFSWICDVRMYNQVLTAGNVSTLFSAGPV